MGEVPYYEHTEAIAVIKFRGGEGVVVAEYGVRDVEAIVISVSPSPAELDSEFIREIYEEFGIDLSRLG